MSFLNVSNREHIQVDSAYVFYNVLSRHFTKDREFVFVSPAPLTDPNSIHVPMEFGFDKYEVRFSFDWPYISNILKRIRPDVLMINQVEHTAHYRAVLESLGQKALIVAYTHYIPYVLGPDGKIVADASLNNAGLGRAVRFSFFTGLIAADLVFTHSETAMNLLRILYKENGEPFDGGKFVVNPPPMDPFMSDGNDRPENKAFYNHRLYKHYGSEFFVGLAKEIPDRFDIRLNVLDVLGERSEARRRMDPSVEEAREKLSGIRNVSIVSDTYDRYRYRETVKGSLFSIAPFKENCIWAMSCIDSMGMGVPVVAPNVAWFKEFMPPDLRFSTMEEALGIIRKLVGDTEFWDTKSREAKERVAHLAPAKRVEVFLSAFKERAFKWN